MTTLIPCLRYRDAPTAIAFLCDVLGMQQHMVVANDDGTIAHAQLSLGGGMIMLGSVVESEFGVHIAQPDEIGGKETQCVYMVAAAVDDVYAKVQVAGWKVLMPIKNQDYGSREFVCADPEGHIWCLGNYDPWVTAAV